MFDGDWWSVMIRLEQKNVKLQKVEKGDILMNGMFKYYMLSRFQIPELLRAHQIKEKKNHLQTYSLRMNGLMISELCEEKRDMLLIKSTQAQEIRMSGIHLT